MWCSNEQCLNGWRIKRSKTCRECDAKHLLTNPCSRHGGITINTMIGWICPRFSRKRIDYNLKPPSDERALLQGYAIDVKPFPVALVQSLQNTKSCTNEVSCIHTSLCMMIIIQIAQRKSMRDEEVSIGILTRFGNILKQYFYFIRFLPFNVNYTLPDLPLDSRFWNVLKFKSQEGFNV